MGLYLRTLTLLSLLYMVGVCHDISLNEPKSECVPRNATARPKVSSISRSTVWITITDYTTVYPSTTPTSDPSPSESFMFHPSSEMQTSSDQVAIHSTQQTSTPRKPSTRSCGTKSSRSGSRTTTSPESSESEIVNEATSTSLSSTAPQVVPGVEMSTSFWSTVFDTDLSTFVTSPASMLAAPETPPQETDDAPSSTPRPRTKTCSPRRKRQVSKSISKNDLPASPTTTPDTPKPPYFAGYHRVIHPSASKGTQKALEPRKMDVGEDTAAVETGTRGPNAEETSGERWRQMKGDVGNGEMWAGVEEEGTGVSGKGEDAEVADATLCLE